MKFLLTLATIGINDFFNYTQNKNNSIDSNLLMESVGQSILIVLIIGISIYTALYIPIKLYQINKNTKIIKEYLKDINKNLSELNKKEKKDFEIKDYGIEIVENIDINK